MKNLILFIIVIFLITSCKKDEENEEIQSGQFSLQFSSAKELSQNQYSFNLGEIKTSKNFYFLLLNVGDMPIFDIALSSDNPNFIISPSKISYLGSTKSLSANDSNLISPIITLGIEHGKKIDGNGYGNLLNMGANIATITVEGKTIKNKDTIILSINPIMVVDAKLMDIRFYVNNQEIDLNNPSGSLTTSIRGIGTIPYYHIDFINRPIKIENSGNTLINMQILGNSVDTITLEHNNSVDSLIVKGKDMVITIGNRTGVGNHAVFIFNSEGTTVINNKLKLLDDGNAYFALFRWN